MSIIIGVYSGSGFRVASRRFPLASQLSGAPDRVGRAVWHPSNLPEDIQFPCNLLLTVIVPVGGS